MSEVKLKKPFARLSACIGQRLEAAEHDGEYGILVFENCFTFAYCHGDDGFYWAYQNLREREVRELRSELLSVGLIDKDEYDALQSAANEASAKHERETYERLRAKFETKP